MAFPTAETIIGLARSLVRQDSGSDIPVVGDTFMLAALSEGNQKYSDAFNASGNEPIVFQREFGITLIAETTLAVACTTASVTLTLPSSASYPVSGTLILWKNGMPDVITYTGNNLSGVLSGVSGIGFAHSIGDTVQLIYALPTNFGDLRENTAFGDGAMLNGLPLSYMGGFPSPGFFSLYDDGTTKSVIFSRQSTGSASILYDKISATIDSIDDTVDVPEKYQFMLVWHLVAYMYTGRADDFQKMTAAQMQSDKVLQRALQNRNTRKVIRSRNFGRISKDYVMIGGNYVPLQ